MSRELRSEKLVANTRVYWFGFRAANSQYMSSKTKRNEEENVYMNYDRVHPYRPDDLDALLKRKSVEQDKIRSTIENAISDAVHEILLPGSDGADVRTVTIPSGQLSRVASRALFQAFVRAADWHKKLAAKQKDFESVPEALGTYSPRAAPTPSCTASRFRCHSLGAAHLSHFFALCQV